MTHTPPLPIPLVCYPAILADAERLAAQFPTLGYQHCLTLAEHCPRSNTRRTMSEIAARRAERARAHRRTTNRLGMAWDR